MSPNETHDCATYYEEECVVRCHDNIFFPAWENIQKKLP